MLRQNPHHAVVAVTDSITRILERDELETRPANELSHIKIHDILIMTVVNFVVMIASMIINYFLFTSLNDHEQGGAWVIAGIVATVVCFITTILMMALSRYREFATERELPSSLKNLTLFFRHYEKLTEISPSC